MTIHLGADHGGFELKAAIKDWLENREYVVIDHGADRLNKTDDYPEFALPLAQAVAGNQQDRGILCCRSGGGMVIAANKVVGIRAVSVDTPKATYHAREHNNANVISLSADWLDTSHTIDILEVFLTTTFDQQSRHAHRLQMIADYESTYSK